MPTTITINPNAQGFYSNWVSGSSTYSKTTAVSDNSDSTVMNPTGFTFDSFTLSDMGVAASSIISSVIVHAKCYAASDGSYSLMGRLAAVDQIQTPAGFTGGAGVNQEVTYDLARPGGGAWSVADVDALEIGIRVNWSVVTPACIKLWAVVTYVPAGVQLEQTRLVAGMHVQRYGSQPDTVELPLTPDFLRVSLVDDIPVWHAFIPTAEGTGSGTETWSRFLGRTVERTITPSDPANIVSLKLEDLREYLHAYRDGGVTPLDPSGIYDGVLVLDPGAVRTWDGSPTTLLSGLSGLIVQVPEDVEPVNYQGRLQEGSATNYILDSAFVRATTSGTPFGAWVFGAGNGTCVVDTAESIFASNVTNKNILITPTTSGGIGPCTLLQASIGATSGYQWFSVDHRENSSSGSMLVRILRASDSKNWTLTAWSSVATNITIPSVTTATRYSFYIDGTTGSTTYTVTFTPNTTGVGHHLYHSQLENALVGRGWPSSRIITSSSAVARATSSLSLTNNSTARVFPATRGTYMARYRTDWASSDVSTGTNRYVSFNSHSTVDAMHLFYNVASCCFTFYQIIANSSYSVNSSQMTLPAGSTGCVAITWQSTEGENDRSSYTMLITTDGLVASTTVAAAFTELSTATWYRGGVSGGGNKWGGALWDERVTPFVLTLPEIRRWMTRAT